jgi:CMP-N-acetylneuraminic acid synthetase
MALDIGLALKQIERTIIVVDEENNLDRTWVDGQTDVLKVNVADSRDEHSFSFLLSTIGQVLEQIRQGAEGIPVYHGFVILDPLCPLRRTDHVKDAIAIYTSQAGQSRPWLSVMSVSRQPNHFHPWKVLKLTHGGELDYFHQKGREVYRRQQLEGHDYFYPNGAVLIIDPMRRETPVLDSPEILGHIIEEPMITIRGKHELDFSKALREHGLV